MAVMSSVTSHSRPLVGEHWLGIQMWLMYRLSYSLAKEKKAQSHITPFEANQKMVITAVIMLSCISRTSILFPAPDPLLPSHPTLLYSSETSALDSICSCLCPLSPLSSQLTPYLTTLWFPILHILQWRFHSQTLHTEQIMMSCPW